MNYENCGAYVCYDSAHLALAFRTEDASLAFLGLDSGGRRPDHKNSHNLLKPSFGAHASAFAKKGTAAPDIRHGPDGLRAEGSAGVFAFTPDNDPRSFTLAFEAPPGETLPATFFVASLSIATAPPAVWADALPLRRRRPPRPGRPGRFRRPPARTWRLPMLVHFPDYGTLRIESAEPGGDADIVCREALVPSSEMRGLSLGFKNHGYHNWMVALHHGVSRLEFRLVGRASARRRAALRFLVEPEIAPKAPFVDEPRWNGFRRAWLNNFPIQRFSLSMGDNLALEGVGHLAIHNKADMLSLCDPADHPLFGRLRDTFVRTLDLTFARCQAPDGEIQDAYRWCAKAPGAPPGAFLDVTPATLVAACVALRWAPDRLPAWLPAMLRAADFLLGLDADGDGLLESPFSGTSFHAPWPFPGSRPRNWWDNFAFGHKDAWTNLLAHRALRLVADAARAGGRVADAARIDAFLVPFRESLLRELLNPETGLLAGWRDAEGRLHDYGFTFPAAMAVNEGVLTRSEGRRMLRRLLRAMREAGFGDNRYGIPGNTRPVPLGVDTIGWAFMGAWPRYENGGCCGLAAWHFLRALYRVGLEREADAIYFRMLDTFENWPTHSGLFPGYMESVDWRTKDGQPCGYNYLADNYLFLGAGYLAHSGRQHTALA